MRQEHRSQMLTFVRNFGCELIENPMQRTVDIHIGRDEDPKGSFPFISISPMDINNAEYRNSARGLAELLREKCFIVKTIAKVVGLDGAEDENGYKIMPAFIERMNDEFDMFFIDPDDDDQDGCVFTALVGQDRVIVPYEVAIQATTDELIEELIQYVYDRC